MLRIYALLIFLWACGEDTTKNQIANPEEKNSRIENDFPSEPSPKSSNNSAEVKGQSSYKPVPRHVGLMKTSRATAYYPSSSPMEGGYKDRFGNPLRTLQDFLDGKASYVSVAMDKNLNLPNGQIVRIPELDNHFKRQINHTFKIFASC